MAKHLVVLSGPDEGRVFPLANQTLLLGRSRATEARLIDPHVAQVHCQVLGQDDQFTLRDFDSDAGTFVNGKKITEQTLKVGDIIRIGNTHLQVTDDEHPDKHDANATIDDSVRTPTKIAKPDSSDWVKELPGQNFGQFKIGTMFAKSRTGCFFHARHIKKNLDVALKVLEPGYGASDDMVQRFNRAMRVMLPLEHPNLVRVHGAGKTGPHCWVAMEYVRAESLAAIIARTQTSGQFDWRSVLRMMIYLARGLAYAHANKAIHKNVTPPHILVGKNPARTKLSDLMLASAIEQDPTLPAANGKPSDDLPFMSPERTDGPGKAVDGRTDIYSLGASVYTVLTGQPPFQGATSAELVDKIRLQSPPSLKLLHFGLPEPLEMAILKSMAKRPEDRQQTAENLLTDLERIAESQKIACP